MAKPNGAILWQGPSAIDGNPIAVIVTGLASVSSNTKTGAMLQTWILRTDIEPHAAVKAGDDASICGACVHRPSLGSDDAPCYVKTFQAPLAVYRAFHRGNYPDWSDLDEYPLQGTINRLGSYGDPGAVPEHVWSRYTLDSKGYTGYSHQWQDRPDLKPYCMASVDSREERDLAMSQGWRTFRVGVKGDTADPCEVLCPASKEAGNRTTCAKCKLCAGTTSKSKKSVFIPAH